jgi:PKD repeat protein
MKHFCLLVFTLFTFQTLFAQNYFPQKGKLLPSQYISLEKHFQDYQIYQINATAIKDYLLQQEMKGEVRLDLAPDMQWTMFLESAEMMGKQLTAEVWDGEKIVSYTRAFDPTFKGVTNQGDNVRLTIDENYLSGSIKGNKEEYMIQPLRDYLPFAAVDEYLVYKVSDIKETIEGTCGVEDVVAKKKHLHKQVKSKLANAQKLPPLACYNVDLAAVTDFLFYQKFGSTIAGVQNRVLTVMNLVEGDYTASFNHQLKMVVSRWFNSTSSVEPWSANTDASALVDEFRIWCNANLTGAPTFDVGQFWTNRDFAGSTIGIAYVGAVCSTFKYQALQDFTTNNNLMRVMVSHELGHNFNCNHDAAGATTIMAPAVQNTNTWSATSISTVNAYLPGVINGSCLTACATGGGSAPAANFTSSPSAICPNTVVTFTNTSTNSPTSYSWVFQNGTPATSSVANPTCTWTTAGTYNVTLTATNASGSNSTVKQIIVSQTPIPNFTNTATNLQVNFSNTSTNATTYSWAFGTGATSTQTNPSYTYPSAGTYSVTLTATGACGTQSIVKQVTVTSALSADFSTPVLQGCTPFNVTFNNNSSGATIYNWNMPGATPLTSTATSPSVVYNTVGTYSVTLTASNGVSSVNQVKTNYISVITTPTADFTYVINGSTVTFTNTSVGATSYSWLLGNGNGTSATTPPSTTYPGPGTYNVNLIAFNACGQNSITKTITITAPPTANFSYSNPSGCATHTIQFTNLSTGATSYEWTFTGGSPSTSTATNPTVTYSNAGTFSAFLKATNSGGSTNFGAPNFITIQPTTVADFNFNVTGKAVAFTNTSTDAASYSWVFGDGNTSNNPNLTHTYLNDGVYNVTLTTTNNCGTSTKVKTVTITTPPTANFTLNTVSGCAPFVTSITNTSSSSAATYLWTFTGATPSTSTDKEPIVTYNNGGVFSIKLKVTNSAGVDSLIKTNILTVADKPQTAFTNVNDKLTVTFTNSTINGNNYNWAFGDGSVSNSTSPTHTYVNDGTYNVTLTATNNCGAKSFVKTIMVVSPPTANFAVPNAIGCAPFTVNLNNTSSTNVTAYNWTFAGGVSVNPTDKNPTVVYNSVGTYTIKLKVTNSAGQDSIVKTDIIVVNPKPSASFNQNVDKAKVIFTNSSSNANSYLWNFGDNTTDTTANPTHIYTNDGTYYVSLTAVNTCGNSVKVDTLTIVSPPTAAYTVAATTGCVPLSVSFNNTSSANTLTYQWAFEGGTPATSADKNPTVLYNNIGNYGVTLVASNSQYSNTLIQKNAIVTVAKPSANFTNSNNILTVNFTSTSLGATTYSWDFGDNTPVSNLKNPIHIYQNEGNYTVKLIVTSNCGTDTISKPIAVVALPKANFQAKVTQGCIPLSVGFDNLSSDNATGYQWKFVGGTPDSSVLKNPTVVYDKKGAFDVRLIVSNVSGNDTMFLKQYITTTGAPSAAFGLIINGATVDFKNNSSSDATDFDWEFGDGNTSKLKNPSNTYKKSGLYTVTMTAANACGKSTVKDSILFEFTPVIENDVFEVIKLYPNPTTGKFDVFIKGASSEMVEMTIFNGFGQIIALEKMNFTSGEGIANFDISNLPASAYLLQVSQNGKKSFIKILKL